MGIYSLVLSILPSPMPKRHDLSEEALDGKLSEELQRKLFQWHKSKGEKGPESLKGEIES